MNTHTLKTDPAVFADVLSGAKTFEIRLNDRGFQVGDTLRLLETEHDGADMRSGAPLIYTGREVTKTVSHILTGYGLTEGWCCLSFALPVPAAFPTPHFTWDEDNGLVLFAAQDAALAYADETLGYCRRDAQHDGEWPEAVETIRVGIVTHVTVPDVNEEGGYEYTLGTARPAAVPSPRLR